MTGNPDAPSPVHALFESAGIAPQTAIYRRAEVILGQGDPCDHVVYLQQGTVKVAMMSAAGQEAVVALLRPGDFFGEGCLTGRPVYTASAIAATDCGVLLLPKDPMVRALRTQPAMSARFLAHLLARNIRAEQDLVDQLLHSSEQRVARALLVLARYDRPGTGGRDEPAWIVPPITQATLAQMVGTTRARVNYFINKFERLGFIDRREGLTVYRSLMTVVDGDSTEPTRDGRPRRPRGRRGPPR